LQTNPKQFQVLLAFAMMSGRRFSDYKAVITVDIDQVRAADESLAVKCVVGDFEAAVWKAVRSVVPKSTREVVFFIGARPYSVVSRN